MTLLRKYGVEATIDFPIPKVNDTDFAATGDWTPATGDTKISKDGGDFANTTNNPAATGGSGSVGWKLTLTATEMQAARVAIQIVDAAVENQFILIETYGNASAQHAVDLDDAVRAGLTALPNAAADAAGGLPISDAGGLDMDFISTAAVSAANNASALVTTVGVAGAGLTAADDAVIAAVATAQADLDLLTGSDGATLATTQGNYAPAKAGDAMALTSSERTTLAGVVWTVGNMATAAMKRVADFVLRRNTANAAASSETGLDTLSFRSPIGAVRKLTNHINTTATAGKLTIMEEDDATPAATQTLATDASAEPITGANTD